MCHASTLRTSDSASGTRPQIIHATPTLRSIRAGRSFIPPIVAIAYRTFDMAVSYSRFRVGDSSNWRSGGKGRCDIAYRAVQQERIVFRGQKATTAPESRRVMVDAAHHQSAPADQLRGGDTALKRMLDEACSDSFSDPGQIRSKLSQQQAGHRIGWLSGADRTGQGAGRHRRGREPIIADHAAGLVNDEDRGKAFLLVRQSARLQPLIERGLAAGEVRYIMRGGQQFRFAEGHVSALGLLATCLPGGAPAGQRHHLQHRCGRPGHRLQEGIKAF